MTEGEKAGEDTRARRFSDAVAERLTGFHVDAGHNASTSGLYEFVGSLLVLTFILSAQYCRGDDDPRAQAPLEVSSVEASSEGMTLTLSRTNSGLLWDWISISGSDSLASNGTWHLMNVAPWPEHAAYMQWTDSAADIAASRFYRVVLNADSDRDGLPDWWELHHFDDPTNAVASDDADQDTWNNLQEYRRGGNPTNVWLPDTNNVLKLTVLTPFR